jgi:hypothetical protein
MSSRISLRNLDIYVNEKWPQLPKRLANKQPKPLQPIPEENETIKEKTATVAMENHSRLRNAKEE